MFSDNKKDRQNTDLISSQNIISKGTKIIGDLISEGDLRIDGTIEGNLKTPGKIVVGKSGSIKGTLNGTDAHFEGKFSGKLSLSGTLTLKSSAHIEGEVVLGKLEVEPGATFNVTCAMKGAVKEFHSKNEQKDTSKPGQETA
ncbi:bactofilin family protein [Xanthomarina sp. F2636L]|uniref:bactofilin family protein n=1 Tax=Xanthomarina sp. F2636L TaxID=2996018 RepID=UPI00225E06A4|nr:polymer-forming cytoskeletal protein [Xanthomarina sp. F2636L]MCX7551356.1 polymer-forming cytoskeletal protein [Xanthomarina sp. F2636L]